MIPEKTANWNKARRKKDYRSSNDIYQYLNLTSTVFEKELLYTGNTGNEALKDFYYYPVK